MAKHAKARKTAPITLHPTAEIPLTRLRLSDSNIRRVYSDESIADLADSIARRGLLQSLNVRPILDADGQETGDYEIPAGGRRFRALSLLVRQKRLPPDAPIACIVRTGGLAEDDSLAENSDREALHPLDEFRAFAALKAKGRSDEDIAASYRVIPAVVRQRLRLAAASPTLQEAYVTDEIDLEQLMAFCVSEDHARQDSVFRELRTAHSLNEWTIKRRMTEDAVPTTDRRVMFVGLAAYEAAGGHVERDLFDNAETGYLRDIDLLTHLVDEKLTALRDELLSNGWKWVTAAVTIPFADQQAYVRLIPTPVELTDKEQRKLTKLQARLQEFEALDELDDQQQQEVDALTNAVDALENRPGHFEPQEMASAGVMISLGHDGRPVYAFGLIRPTDVVRDEASSTADEVCGGSEPSPAEASDDDNAPLSAALLKDLTAFRTVALRNALAQSPETAQFAVLHSLTLQHFYHRSAFSCLQISAREEFASTADGLAEWKATQDLHARDDTWRSKLPKDPAYLWTALQAMPAALRTLLFAHVAAFTINAVRIANLSSRETATHANQLATSLGLNMSSAGWTTTADNYFGRVTKPRILEAVTEAKGAETAALLNDLKKSEMAAEAERLVQGTGWLPELMRTPVPDVATPLPAFLAG